MIRRERSSRAAATAVAALLLCFPGSPALAANTAKAVSGSQQNGTGTWAAVATTASAARFGTGALSLNFTGIGSFLTPLYFNVANTGTLPLIGEIVSATTTNAPAVIEACSATWNESTNLCPSGTITTVVSTGAAPQTFAAALAATGSIARLRARLTTILDIGQVSTITVGISVTRAQVRAATTQTS